MNLERRKELPIVERRPLSRRGSLPIALASMMLAGVFGLVPAVEAALENGGKGAQGLIGADDDNLNNLVVQPPDRMANQSLNNTDVLIGGFGNDILIGLLGNDVLHGGPGSDRSRLSRRRVEERTR